jgi:ATP-dependent DNA ligase
MVEALSVPPKSKFSLHKRRMLRMYQPCLPARSTEAPTDPLWILEIKHDGFRIIVRRVAAS